MSIPITTYFKQRDEELVIAKFRQAVHDRAGRHCELGLHGCTGRSIHAHHVLRKSQGGQNTVENGLALCTSCHEYVHGVGVITGESYREGWLQRRNPRPGDHHWEGE